MLNYRAELSPHRDEPDALPASGNHAAGSDLMFQKTQVHNMPGETTIDEARTVVEYNESSQPHVAAGIINREQDQNSARKSSRLRCRKQVETSTTTSELEVKTNAELSLQQADTETLNDVDKEVDPKPVRRSSRIRGQQQQQMMQAEKSVNQISQADCSNQDVRLSSEDNTVAENNRSSEPNVAAGICDRKWDENSARKNSRLSRKKQKKANDAASELEVEINAEPQLLQADTEPLHDVATELELKPLRRRLRTFGEQKKQVIQPEKLVNQISEIDCSRQHSCEVLMLSQHEVGSHTTTEISHIEEKQFQPKPRRRNMRTRQWQKKQTETSLNQKAKSERSCSAATEAKHRMNKGMASKALELDNKDEKSGEDSNSLHEYPCTESGINENVSHHEVASQNSGKSAEAKHRMDRVMASVALDLNNEDEKSHEDSNSLHENLCTESNIHENINHHEIMNQNFSEKSTEAKHRMDRVMASIAVDLNNEDENSDQDCSSLHKNSSAESDVPEDISHPEILSQNSSVIASEEYVDISSPVDNSQSSQMYSGKSMLHTVCSGKPALQDMGSIVSTLDERTYERGNPIAGHSECSETVASQPPHRSKCSVASDYAGFFPSRDVSQSRGNVHQTQLQVVQKMADAVGYSSTKVNEIPSSLLEVHSEIGLSDEMMSEFSRTSQRSCRQKCSVVASEYTFDLQAAQELHETQQQVLTAGVDYDSPDVNEIPSSLPDILYSHDWQKQAASREDPIIDHGEFSQTGVSQQSRRPKCSFAASEYKLQAAQLVHETQQQVSTAGVDYSSSPEMDEIPNSMPEIHSQIYYSDDWQKQTAANREDSATDYRECSQTSTPEVNEIPSSLRYIHCSDDTQKHAAYREDHIMENSEFSQRAASQQSCRQKCSFVTSGYTCGLQAAQMLHKTQQQVSTAGVNCSSQEMNEIPSSLPPSYQGWHNTDTDQRGIGANDGDGVSMSDIDDSQACDEGAQASASQAVVQRCDKFSEPQLILVLSSERQRLCNDAADQSNAVADGGDLIDFSDINASGKGASMNESRANVQRRAKVSEPQLILMLPSEYEANAPDEVELQGR